MIQRNIAVGSKMAAELVANALENFHDIICSTAHCSYGYSTMAWNFGQYTFYIEGDCVLEARFGMVLTQNWYKDLRIAPEFWQIVSW